MQRTTTMRCLLGSMVAIVACASPSVPDQPGPATVRERLGAPARLAIIADASRGVISARRRVTAGWEQGTATLVIDNGELDLALDHAGDLEIRAFAVTPHTIDLPDSVFGGPAQLRDVRLTLAAAAAFVPSWSDDDDAVAIDSVKFELAWTLAIGDAAFPLATQQLPPLPMAIRLTGTGAEVDARIGVTAPGPVWSWADLVELDDLQLVLEAASD
jgi:hypothetical protein